MKQFKIILLVCCVVLAMTLVGCKSQANVIPPRTIETTKELEKTVFVKDTFFSVEKDSSFYKAYIDCVNGKPVIKDVKSKPGKNLQPPKVKIDGNYIKIDCELEAQKLFYSWKETYIKEHNNTKETVPLTIKLPLTKWESIQIYCGKIFMFLLLVLLILIVLRATKKI